MKLKERIEVYGNGLIIVTDFKNLNPTDFSPLYNETKKELQQNIFIISPDGRVFLNSREALSDVVRQIFEMLIRYDLKTLKKVSKSLRKKYPSVKNANDVVALPKDSRYQALVMLMIPAELKRREIQSRYNKI